MSSDFEYHTSLSVVKGVGAKRLEKLAYCGLHTFRDALFHFPIRYEDKTHIIPVEHLIEGQAALVQGQIVRVHQIKKTGKNIVFVDIQDESGTLSLTFFYLNHAQVQSLKKNSLLRCYGFYKNNSMAHPEYKLLSDDTEPLPQTLTPIYSTTEGLPQGSLQKIIAQVVNLFFAKQGKTQTGVALHFIHHPPAQTDVPALLARAHPLCQHLIREELYTQLLSVQQLKAQRRAGLACALGSQSNTPVLLKQLFGNLAFDLTNAQQRVIDEILNDLSKTQPMMRLVQGDVGSGKTVVAAAAALVALSAGAQVALMAPTEILATQLFSCFSQWFEPLGFRCVWLCGSMSVSAKQAALSQLASDQALIAIGTHALFQESVCFNNVGLLIIDEQHRFGVHQRLALMNKGNKGDNGVHQLVLTATPIPRTLAMTQYASLDLSIIDELPPGRQPIKTVVMSQVRRPEIIQKIKALCQAGKQVYWVCTAIEESEVLDVQAAQASFTLLQNECVDCRVGLVHGRLPAQEKEAVMADFRSGNISILVATTVIEVGVDVPNASLLIIENPERLGLAQLHQLRGRVGRGADQSFCILLYKPPLSEPAKARLTVLRESQDGFVIAEKDLALRGSGEVLGAKQSGLANFKIADLVRDQATITQLYNQIHSDPELALSSARYTALVNCWIGAEIELPCV